MTQGTAVCHLLRLGRVAFLSFDVPRKLLLGDSLTAAGALPKPVPFVTLCQQVFSQAGYLNHLPAVVASGQHEAVFPVVEVQALFCEGLIPLPTKDAQIIQIVVIWDFWSVRWGSFPSLRV